MVECRYCGEVFYADPGRFGARCRRCREPLYERREASLPLPAEGTAGECSIHPHNPSVGTCQSCGAVLCAVCRIRWRDRTLCPPCVERALEEKGPKPEDVKIHQRQAQFALTAGIGAWVLFLAAAVLFATRSASEGSKTLTNLLGLLSLAVALLGSGQALSALRTRGNRMILATWGLVLTSAQAGVLLGLLSLGVWER
jgi:hypothetical protein